MKHLRKLVTVLIALALASLAHAQESKVFQDGRYWIEETSGSISSARNLKVLADAGSVKVQGAGQSNVTYVIRKRVAAGNEQQARREFEKFRVSAANLGETALIKGHCMSDTGRSRLSVNYEIRDAAERRAWSIRALAAADLRSITSMVASMARPAAETSASTLSTALFPLPAVAARSISAPSAATFASRPAAATSASAWPTAS